MTIPTIILIGELDDWTPAKDCERWMERRAGKGAPVKLVIYPGAIMPLTWPRFEMARDPMAIGSNTMRMLRGGRFWKCMTSWRLNSFQFGGTHPYSLFHLRCCPSGHSPFGSLDMPQWLRRKALLSNALSSRIIALRSEWMQR